MELYINITFCFLPLIAVLVLALFKVRGFKAGWGLWAIGAGFAAIIPIIVIQHFIQKMPVLFNKNLFSLLLTAILFNGLIEEGVKMLFLFLLPAKKIPYKSFLTASLIAGTAFGSFEALIYLVAGQTDTMPRLFTALVLHALCSGLSGIFVWTTKNAKASAKALITAVFAHGVYNFFAGFTGLLWWFSIAAIFFALVRLRYYYSEN